MISRVTNENLDCGLVTLFMHNYCNYSCSYCSPIHRDNTHRWPATIDAYVNFLNDVRGRNPYLYVEVMGGEPTLWPQFRKFIDAIADERTYIEFSTNASRTLRYWEEFSSGPMYVMMSWHHEQCNDDHFVKVAKIMQHKVSLGIALMVVPENFERAQRLSQRLEELDIEILPRFVRQDIDSAVFLNYTTEQRDWITNYRYLKMKPHAIDWNLPVNLHLDGKKMRFPDILNNGLHNFKGMQCSAGIKRFYVNYDGNIYRCSRRVGPSLGNIFEQYQLPADGIICDQDLCPCKWDALVEKSSSSELGNAIVV